MIGYICGQATHLFTDHCFINAHGVGYRLYISSATRQKLVIGETVTLFTYLNVREDALLLYGFFTAEEYDLFLLLISVTGIGPKVALGILSSVNPDEFRLAVNQNNISILTRIPGIGKKTAERLILELKDKLGDLTATSSVSFSESGTVNNTGSDVYSQALQALLALGYSQGEITPILRTATANTTTVEETIRLVLREMGNRR